MKSLMFTMLCGCVLLVDGPAAGEDEPKVDCKDPITQSDMNYCAAEDYEKADAALNAQWKLTKQAMVRWDSGMDDNLKGAEKALLAAQRAWIAYRDAHCEVEGFRARGGTLEPLLVSACLETLTLQRTEDLKALATDVGN